MAKYKQLCSRCKKNYVVVGRGSRYVLCYDCQKGEMEGDIKDPEMKKMFDIPEEYFKENSFLRSIKINYLKFGTLSDRQIEVFKKVVNDVKEAKEGGDDKKDDKKEAPKDK